MAKTKKIKDPEKKFALKLFVRDRFNFPQLYPDGTNIIDGIILKDIKRKIELSQSEIKKYGITIKDDKIKWDKNGDKTVTISFTSPEIKFLKDQVSRLDKTNKVPQNLLDVILKIQDINLDKK